MSNRDKWQCFICAGIVVLGLAWSGLWHVLLGDGWPTSILGAIYWTAGFVATLMSAELAAKITGRWRDGSY